MGRSIIDHGLADIRGASQSAATPQSRSRIPRIRDNDDGILDSGCEQPYFRRRRILRIVTGLQQLGTFVGAVKLEHPQVPDLDALLRLVYESGLG